MKILDKYLILTSIVAVLIFGFLAFQKEDNSITSGNYFSPPYTSGLVKEPTPTQTNSQNLEVNPTNTPTPEVVNNSNQEVSGVSSQATPTYTPINIPTNTPINNYIPPYDENYLQNEMNNILNEQLAKEEAVRQACYIERNNATADLKNEISSKYLELSGVRESVLKIASQVGMSQGRIDARIAYGEKEIQDEINSLEWQILSIEMQYNCY